MKLFPINRLKAEENRSENIGMIRGLTQSSYLGNNLCVCRVLGQYLMFVNTLDERLGIQLQMNGYWEMSITEFVARSLKPGMTAVDIGANYGYFSLLMSTLVGPKGSVYAIEANPHLASLIQKSIKLNGVKDRVQVINKAITDYASEAAEFIYCEDHFMNGGLEETKDQERIEALQLKRIAVQTTSLDEQLADAGAIDFMKIDIEGSEDKFWYGSQQVRAANPQMVMLMEFNRNKYQQVEQFVEQIFDQGYQVQNIERSQLHYQPMSATDLLSSNTSKHMMLAISRH